MKVELLADRTKEEIAEIWTKHHFHKDTVCAVIPADVFAQMKERYLVHKTVSTK